MTCSTEDIFIIIVCYYIIIIMYVLNKEFYNENFILSYQLPVYVKNIPF